MTLFANFKSWITFPQASNLYQDFVQGVSVVRVLVTMLPEQAFLEMEKIRLQHRLLRINKRLSSAYWRLGEQGLVVLHLQNQSPSESNEPVPEEEIGQAYQQIEEILKDQKQVLDEIEQTKDIGNAN